MKPSTRGVLDYLRTHPEGMTSRDAWLELGCSRLAARVDDLHREGYTVDSEYVTVRTGERNARVSRYTLRENAQIGLGLR